MGRSHRRHTYNHYNIIVCAALCSGGAELGCAPCCRLCFGEDGYADFRGKGTSAVSYRPGHRQLQDDKAQRFAATGEGHRGRHGATRGQRETASTFPSAGGNRQVRYAEGETQYERLRSRGEGEGQRWQTLTPEPWHRLGQTDAEGG